MNTSRLKPLSPRIAPAGAVAATLGASENPPMDICYDYLETPIGRLLLAADDAGLRYVEFDLAGQGERIGPSWRRGRHRLGDVIAQFEAYFAGELHVFDLPLAAVGTDFRKSVWDELVRIPYGETISYGELARRIGDPHQLLDHFGMLALNVVAFAGVAAHVVERQREFVPFGHLARASAVAGRECFVTAARMGEHEFVASVAHGFQAVFPVVEQK